MKIARLLFAALLGHLLIIGLFCIDQKKMTSADIQKKSFIHSTLESLQTKVSFMKLDSGNWIFIDKEMGGIHPFDFLQKSIDVMRKDLEPAIRNLKSEIQL